MYTVSEEWKTNQNATVRKQGYVNVIFNNINIPATRIKSVKHKRSIDPMSISLPENSIVIELFNYDDYYSDLYDEYADERYAIIVKYGYKLSSGDEEIPGGTFYTFGISNDDGILTIEGNSSLGLVDENTLIETGTIEPVTDEIIWESNDSSQQTITYNEVNETKAYTTVFEDVLDKVKEISGITITADKEFNSYSFISHTVIDTPANILQMLCNASLKRCHIERDDSIMITDITNKNTVLYVDAIIQKNCLKEPSYSVSKHIKNIEITSYDINEGDKQEYNRETSAESFSLTGIDRTKYCFYSLVFTGRPALKEITTSNRGYNFHFTSSSNRNVTLTVVDMTSGGSTTKSYSVNTTGALCDIENNVMSPVSTQKIADYFSNRKIYEFYVRGNPARDAGDYVWVSLVNDEDTQTYVKGLILSSELTFDGSFKETLSVRIIENDFE